ncbi:MAG: hypothetical protein ACRCXM_16165 [Beijerinckiaceae bacterium]
MAVPKHPVARVGRCEMKSMLRSSDAVTATMQARLLSNALDRLFKLVMMMPDMTTEEINERIRAYFQTALNRSLVHAQLLPGDPMVDLDEEADFRVSRSRTCAGSSLGGPSARWSWRKPRSCWPIPLRSQPSRSGYRPDRV